MKLGIIGTGLIVQEFLPKLVQFDGIEVLALQGLAELQAETQQLADDNGIAHAVNNFQALLETGIDTVYIAVPNFLHFAYSKQALEASLHVIVEKPATSNFRELEELVALADKQGSFIFEAVTTPYLHGFKKIQEWLSRIGDIKLVQSHYSQYSRRYDDFKRGQILPAFDPSKAGGAMMDLNLYNLHMVIALFGAPSSQSYQANITNQIDTSGILTMTYPNFQALCVAAKDSRGLAKTIIQGDKGFIETSLPANAIGKVTLELYDGTVETFEEDSFENRLAPEFSRFITIINEENQAAYQESIERSLTVSKVQTQARLSVGISFPADQ